MKLSNFKKNLAFLISSLFGVGFIPFAPGTFGSLFSLLFIIPVILFYGYIGLIIFSVLIFLIGIISSCEVLKYTKHDPGLIVIDEMLGQSATFLPLASFMYRIQDKNLSLFFIILVVGFVLFRIFDIFKPGLVGIIDKKIKNTYGVMLDDLVAGLFASIILLIVTFSLTVISNYIIKLY